MAKTYETIIGLEVHVELATATKIFCGCSTAFGARPNTQVCPVCSGMPGALPVLNRKVVEYAMSVGLATHCQINQHCQFDRKNYFYPDNPQNYQISQLYEPICQNGYLDVVTEKGEQRRIRIHEIHMEEDAGKLIHDERESKSYVDLNRSGVPLIEIVSEPDMRSAEDVIAYLDALRLICQYLGVSDCKLQEGSMRADINLSVREAGSDTLGTRTETKNLSSFRAISNMIAHEQARQIDLLASGHPVVQETRHWNEDRGTSYAMRSKENAQDYRYFPDPDLPPIQIDDAWLEETRASLPEFRDARCARYEQDYGLSHYDAEILTEQKALADLFEDTVSAGASPKKTANWLMGETLRLWKEAGQDSDALCFSAAHLAALIRMTEDGMINNQVAKEVFAHVFQDDIDPIAYVEENGLASVQNDDALQDTIKKVLAENPDVVTQYQEGKTKVLGFLVGQTMKELQGKGDPGAINRLLVSLLQEQ